jgi:hypothetical protein
VILKPSHECFAPLRAPGKMTPHRSFCPTNAGHSTQNEAGCHQGNDVGERWLDDRGAHRLRPAAGVLALLLALFVAATSGCGGQRPASPPPAVAEPVAAVAAAPPAVEPVRVPPVRPGQFRVCAFAFHSPDELATIEAELSSDDFVFTDLTPVFPGGEDSAGTVSSRKPAGWFMDRCRPDLSCDIVVYSGEFAGSFFGNYGFSVDVQEMEEASCQPRCRGLFADPLEVFLLACNTLASKNADRRTPEEYRHVLLMHGFNHADAERVVNQRYGPLGPSFRESLRRMFMGVPRIYGFSSVAPLGVATAPLLREYFRRKGDYARYLEDAGRDSAPNKELLAAFAGTGLMQTSGVSASDPTGADHALVCRLYDDTETVSDRLRVVRRLLERRDFLSFAPTVEVFLGRHPPAQYAGAERRLFRDIQSLEEPRRQVTELMHRLNVSVLKMQLANLARQFAWITAAEHDRIAAEGLKQLLAEPLSTEVADIGCELSKYVPTGAGLRSEDIPDQLLWHAEGYRLLDCLSPTDPRLTERMLNGFTNIDEATRLWAAYALSRRRPLEDAVLIGMAPRLEDSSAEVRGIVQRAFKAHAPLSPRVLAAIRDRDPALAETLAAQKVN